MDAKKGRAAGPNRIVNWIKGHYTRQGLWSLFLMCTFPLQVWTLILSFRDISWLTDRTNAWDAVGVVGYGLLFAFLESVILFGVMAALGYLVSNHWDPDRRVAALTVLVLMAAVWAMLEQLFFLIGTGMPGWLIGLLVRSGHPARLFYPALLGVLVVTILGPVLLVLRSERAYGAVRALIDRLSVLSVFYLFLDVIGLIIVIVRNV